MKTKIMKRFLLIGGIVAGVGISIVIIQAASFLPNSSSAALKKITVPSMTKKDDVPKTDSELLKTKYTAPKDATPKDATPKDATPKDATPKDAPKTTIQPTDTKTPSIITPLDKLKPAADPQSALISPKTTDTKLQDLLETLTDAKKSTESTAKESTAKESTAKESTAKTPLATPKNTSATQIPLSPEKLIPLSEALELKPIITTPFDKVVLPLEDIIITPKSPENTVILEKVISEYKDDAEITLPLPSLKEKNTEIFLTVTELFKDVSPSSSAYQAITDITDLMKQQGNFILPAGKKFKPRNKLRPSFAAQIALSIAGEACGTGKGAARAKACLAKAYELGLFEKNALADKPMTRGNFYELLLAVLKIPAVESTEGLLCQDVDSSHAYAEIVATAKQYGIARRYTIKGEGGYCLPDAPLTKADAAVIASKALEAKQKLGR